MGRITKLLVFAVVLLFGFHMMTLSVSAQTITQDGLEISLTTDKEEYLSGEEVKLILKIKNTGEEKVTNIQISDVISEGYNLPEEFVEELKAIEELGTGEEIVLDTVLEVEENNTSGGNTSGGNTSGGSTSGGSTSGGNASSGNTSDGGSAGGNTSEGSTTQENTGVSGTEDKKNDKVVTEESDADKDSEVTEEDKDTSEKDDIGATETGKDTEAGKEEADDAEDLISGKEETKEEVKEETKNVSSIPIEDLEDSEDEEEKSGVGLWIAIGGVLCVALVAVVVLKHKFSKGALSFLLCVVTAGAILASDVCEAEAATVEKEVSVTETFVYAGKEVSITFEFTYDYEDGYTLVWEEEFEEESLNRNDWNVELHEPGWVNAELQEYVNSTENIYLEDGKLIIQALEEVDELGNKTYTSGRINTQGKHDYKYGKFEAKIKVPSGMGFLPAFWMMPTDESIYGQWPKCGEIDIMEVMGQSTDTVHGTLHFGDPHTQKQGTYVLEEGDFAEEFHVFAVEWEPGEFRFYVDGILYATQNEWFTKKEGFDKVTYPAPYDQSFYMILNLAVGGSWVGYPDETTEFGENAQLVVDYVKVYQKDGYDEDVQEPGKEDVELREPDSTGNYVINGDFATQEELEDAQDWVLLLAGGEAAADIVDEKLQIETTDAGTLDYSVQLVQANIPLEKGWTYKISFDAYAAEERTMIVDISAPDLNYSRYFADTKVTLKTSVQHYEYTFDMTADSDTNARLEFNLGNQVSVAAVFLDNVRVEKVEACDDKEVITLPDGNYIFNGEFQEGADRLSYWEVVNNCSAEYSVSNTNNIREFVAVIPQGVNEENSFVLKQSNVKLTANKEYELSFDAYADKNGTIKVQIGGNEFEAELGTEKKTYTYKVKAGNFSEFALEFLINMEGTVKIDNVRMVEDGLFINGDFSNDYVGYETYADGSAGAQFTIEEIDGNKAGKVVISNTGDQDWKIQLKQVVTLEEGKWYKLSFDAKATTERSIMYTIQRNGAIHKNADGSENWSPYSKQPVVTLSTEYQNFGHVFQMTGATDTEAVFNISMGAVGGTQITTEHGVFIDNIVLEETEAPEIVTDGNLVKDPKFEDVTSYWQTAILSPGTVKVENEAIIFDIQNVGQNDYDAQLRTFGLALQAGETYKVSYKASSTENRSISVNVMSTSYEWYGGSGADLTNELKNYEFTFTMGDKENLDAGLFFSMGNMGNNTPASVITITDVCVEKVEAGGSEGGETPSEPENPTEPEEPADNNLIKNGNFAAGGENWVAGINSPASATVSYEGNKAIFAIENAGDTNWHLQMFQNDLSIENGQTYKVTLKLKSDQSRSIKWAVLDPSNGYAWYGGESLELEAGVEKTIEYTMNVTGASTTTAQFQITMAPDSDSTNVPTTSHVVEISEVSIVKVEAGGSEGGEGNEGGETPSEPENPTEPEEPADNNLIKNGNFAAGGENWIAGINSPASATVSYEGNKAIFAIENAGDTNWHLQMFQNDLSIENGQTYKVTLKLKSDQSRSIKWAVLDPSNGYAWYGGESLELEAGVEKTIEYTMNVTGASTTTAQFQITMAPDSDSTNVPTTSHVVEISEVSIVKVVQ